MKCSHFILLKSTYSTEEFARLYLHEIVCFHGISLSISSNRSVQFTSRFWRSFKKELGTKVKLITIFHPQMNGQAEHTTQTIKDILWSCVINLMGNWNDHLSIMEFSNNNIYHSSIFMKPFNTLYGKRCRYSVWWFEVDEFTLLGPEIVYEAMEKVRMIRDRFKKAYSRAKMLCWKY